MKKELILDKNNPASNLQEEIIKRVVNRNIKKFGGFSGKIFASFLLNRLMAVRCSSN